MLSDANRNGNGMSESEVAELFLDVFSGGGMEGTSIFFLLLSFLWEGFQEEGEHQCKREMEYYGIGVGESERELFCRVRQGLEGLGPSADQGLPYFDIKYITSLPR